MKQYEKKVVRRRLQKIDFTGFLFFSVKCQEYLKVYIKTNFEKKGKKESEKVTETKKK